MTEMSLTAMGASARQATALMKVLSNESRLMVLCHLRDGEKSVGALEDLVGLGQSALSQHLARMRAVGTCSTLVSALRWRNPRSPRPQRSPPSACGSASTTTLASGG